ncbi:hypothetical protein GCM10027589_34980 [Actinocorallia lasiicapitis]
MTAGRGAVAGRLLVVLLGLLGFALPGVGAARAAQELPGMHAAGGCRGAVVAVATERGGELVTPVVQAGVLPEDVKVRAPWVGVFLVEDEPGELRWAVGQVAACRGPPGARE